MNKVNGEVFVEESGVRILASKGQLLDTQVKDVYVNIPHAPAGGDSHLLLTGGFSGGLGDGLKILQEAPIGTASTFAGWKGEGDLQGSLDLDVPLAKGTEPKIVVDFKTDKARLQLAEPPLELTQLKGDFRFDSAKGLSGQKISAQAFDRPITAQIFAEGKPGNISTRVTANGSGHRQAPHGLVENQPAVAGLRRYSLPVASDPRRRRQPVNGQFQPQGCRGGPARHRSACRPARDVTAPFA